MPLYHLILISLIQGITEFLPVSSSGHLILLPGLTGLSDQGPVIDVAESKALHKVFGNHLYSMNINSTKSMTGHLLGAAGAVEAISSILSINNGIIPPTINHQTKVLLIA